MQPNNWSVKDTVVVAADRNHTHFWNHSHAVQPSVSAEDSISSVACSWPAPSEPLHADVSVLPHDQGPSLAVHSPVWTTDTSIQSVLPS